MGGIISLLGLACCTCGMLGSCMNCKKFAGADDHYDASSVSVTTRILYSLFLVVGLVLAVVFRHNGTLVNKVPFLSSYCEGTAFESFCYGTYAVYRMSFVLTLFFLIHVGLSLSIIGSPRVRLSLQSHGFGLKVLIFVIAILASFAIPDSFFYGYGYVAAIGAAAFLIIQIIVLLDFSFTLNNRLADKAYEADDNAGGDGSGANIHKILLVGGTAAVWIAGLVFAVLSFIFFSSKLVCGLIAAFVVIVGVTLGGASLKFEHGSILTAGLVFAYTSYLAFSANSSAFLQCIVLSPSATPVPKHAHEGTFHIPPEVSLSISVAIAGASLFWACVSSGGSNQSFKFESSAHDAAHRLPEEEGLVDAERQDIRRQRREIEEAEVTLATSHFTFFHVVMMTASMYLAMLVTSWAVGERFDLSHTGGDCIDQGATVMWVKFATAVVTQVIYAWTLFGPVLLPDRDWGHNTIE